MRQLARHRCSEHMLLFVMFAYYLQAISLCIFYLYISLCCSKIDGFISSQKKPKTTNPTKNPTKPEEKKEEKIEYFTLLLRMTLQKKVFP